MNHQGALGFLLCALVVFASWLPVVQAEGPVCAKTTIPLSAYKACYILSLAPNLPESSVTEIEGQMVVEFREVGGGWTLQQNADLTVTSANAQQTEIRWNYVTWEAKNGKAFRFNMRKEVDGVTEEDLRGSVLLKKQNWHITFKKPYYKILKTKDKILFPIQHLHHLLHLAQRGEKFTSNKVFDGSSLDGPVDVNTFIGKPHHPLQFCNLKNFGQDFGGQQFWPIRFAIYQPQSDRESPDLESAQHVLPNGLPLEYLIDYGEFKIKAVLNSYALLGPDCAAL